MSIVLTSYTVKKGSKAKKSPTLPTHQRRSKAFKALKEYTTTKPYQRPLTTHQKQKTPGNLGFCGLYVAVLSVLDFFDTGSHRFY